MKGIKLVSYVTIAIFLGMILLGQCVVYYANPYSYNITVNQGEEAEYNVDTSYNVPYTAVSMNSSRNPDIKDYYLVSDEYLKFGYNGTSIPDQIKIIVNEMKIYDINLKVINSKEAGNIMSDEILHDSFRCMILFISGYLDSSIYNGTTESLVLEWVHSGGTMYWSGGPIGKCISFENGDILEVKSYSNVFFDTDNAVRDQKNTLYARNLQEGSLTSKLSMLYNSCTFGLRTETLKYEHLSLDYSCDGYSSVTCVKIDNGMITVFGGVVDRFMAQVIASGISYDTKIIECDKIAMNRGPSSGTLKLNDSGSTFVYIFLGDLTVKGARLFVLPP